MRYTSINLKNEKQFLSQYGKIVEYSSIDEKAIKEYPKSGHIVRPMYLIKESQIANLSTWVANKTGKIKLTESTVFNPYEINFIKKEKEILKVELCIQEHHFVPDKILKSNILFFYTIQQLNYYFIIVKNQYINHIFNSEHCIFGWLDFTKGKELLLKADNDINNSMQVFYKEIDKIAHKYQDILFITISDSILLKYTFKITQSNKNNLMFQADKLDFENIIIVFKEIRKIIKQIFKMNIYGVFTYGMNKCHLKPSSYKNVFHTGILSNEFKKLTEMEKVCRNFNEKGDIYLSKVLYKAFMFYWRKNIDFLQKYLVTWRANGVEIRAILFV